MRTTLKLDDHLAKVAKQRAAADGTTLTRLIEEALRLYLLPAPEPDEPFELKLLTTRARLMPGIDLADRDALYDIVDPVA